MRKLNKLTIILLLLVSNSFSQEKALEVYGEIPGECQYFIIPNGTKNVGSKAGFFTINVVTTGMACRWFCGDNANWITTLPTNGTDDGIVSVSYQANPNDVERTAVITIMGNTLTVIQAAAGSDCPDYEPQKTITKSEQMSDWDCDIQNGILEARDRVSLTGAFNYSASTDDPLTIKANPDIILDADYLSIPTNATTRDVKTTGASVGSIPGKAGVSPLGAATYTIPIETPQGIQGLQPNISITYNSQAGKTLLGKGFSIAGLSSITRTGKHHYFDNGQVSGIASSDNDRFVLDGSRLLVVDGNYGTLNSEYRTEQNSFNKITYVNGTNGKYFKVETKDGGTIEYGNTSDSRLSLLNNTYPLAYNINKITDKNGNYIKFTYEQEDGVIRIKRIDYTGNVGFAPQHSITFYYDKRADEKTGYIIGKKFVQKNILREIVVSTNDKIYRKYNFKYAKDNINESILSEIVLSNKAGEELNSTVFEWGDYNNTMTKDVGTPPAVTDVSRDDIACFSNDMDLDGLSDIIYFYEKDGYIYLTFNYTRSDYQGNINYWVSESETSSLGPKNNGELISEILPFWGDFWGTGINYMVIPRYSLYDGKVDKINFEFATTGGSDLGNRTVNITNGEMPLYARTDFDLDGKSEIFILEKEDTDGNYKGTLLTLVSGGVWSDDNYAFNLSEQPRAMLTGDYNNDGLTDLRIVTKRKIYTFKNVNGTIDDTSYTVKDFSNIQCNEARNGDFNGDGALDVLIVGENDEVVAVAYGNGNYGVTIEYYSSIMGIVDPDTDRDNNQDNVMVMDFNHDGLSDFILFDGVFKWDGSHKDFKEFNVYWYQSNGNGFTLKEKATTTNQNHAYRKFYTAGDFNGDGRQDLFNYGFDCLEESTFTSLGRFYYSFNTNFEANKLISIHNGFNHKTEFKYRPLSFGDNSSGTDFYTVGGAYPFHPSNIYQIPFYAVEKLTTPDGKEGVVNTNYFYKGLRIYKQGRGMLGFDKVTTYNDKTGISVISSSEINETYYVPRTSKTIIKFGEDTLSSIENTYMPKSFDENPKLLFNYVYLSESKDYLLGTSEKSELVRSNLSGEIGRYTKLYKTGNNVDGKDYIYNTFTDVGSWCYSRILSSTVTKTYKTEDDDVQKSTYSYYDNGNIKSSTANGITVTIDEYDTFGNITKQTTSGVPNEELTVLYSYDPSKRFVKSVTNQELGQTSTNAYNDLGQLVSETGVDGLKTSYSYDNWGKLVKTILPNGKKIDSELKWETGSDYTYSVTEKPEGFPETKTYFDSFGRDLKSETIGFGNKKMISEAEYNSKGQLVKTISPYFETEDNTGHITTYGYDDYGRATSVTTNGLTTETIYTIGENQVEERYPSGKSKIAYNNATGKTYKITNNGIDLDYNYWSNGQVKDITVPGATVGLKYDIYGNRDTLTDQNTGSYDFDHDVYGRLTRKESPIGTYTATYEDGRLKTEDDGENAITYTYVENGNGINQIDKVISNGVEFQDLDYDEFGRVAKLSEQVGDKKMDATYSYDMYGRQTAINYPEGFGIKYVYDATTGDLTAITTNSDELIWQLEDINSHSQIVRFKTGSTSNQVETVYSYDGYNILNGINTGSTTIQDITYDFDEREGTLNFRDGVIKDVNETFTYDNLNQLEGVSSDLSDLNLTMAYNNGVTGRMESKSDVGTFAYNSSRPHAITTIDPGTTGYSPVNTDTIIYTTFGKVKRLEQGNNDIEFTYGPNHQRKVMEVYEDGVLKRKVYYFGNYERHEVDGLVSHIYYLFSPSGLTAVYKKDEGANGEMFYIHKDHLGSIHAVTNKYQNVVARYHYTVWGVKQNLNANGSSVSATNALPWLHRGYTGHEHLTEVGYINMNGRVYDPDLGMFISPDPHIQAPEEPINFNRYAYVLNNPLIYTDPSGEFWDQIIVGVIGFGYGYVSHGIETDNWGWDAVISGGIHAAAFLYGYNSKDLAGGSAIAALEYGATSVATDIISSQIPSMTVPISDDMALTMSAGIGYGSGSLVGGVNMSLSYHNNGNVYSLNGGVGTNHAAFGASYSNSNFSASYYLTKYGNEYGHSQWVGGVAISSGQFSARLENDFLAWQGQDRWRSNAVELGFWGGDFVVGTNLYNNYQKKDRDPVDDTGENYHAKKGWFGFGNKIKREYGTWENGQTYRSPLWFGFRAGNNVTRIGYSHSTIQHATQNWFAHQRGFGRLGLFGYANYFKGYDYFDQGGYVYSGYYNPFSLWGK